MKFPLNEQVKEQAALESGLITTYWDHSQKRYVKGVNLLTLFYQLNQLALPISAQLIEKTQPQLDKKTQKTKYKSEYTQNEYLQNMLRVARQQVNHKYLLAGSRYASKDNKRQHSLPHNISYLPAQRGSVKNRASL